MFVNMLLCKNVSYTYFCGTGFFQKLPVFDSPFANIFEHFDNFMNFSYSGYCKIFTDLLKSPVSKLSFDTMIA